MSVKEIIEKYLKENGYDGLFNNEYDLCGCGLDDLCPCNGDILTCQPAYKRQCKDCSEKGTCEMFKEGASYCYSLKPGKEV